MREWDTKPEPPSVRLVGLIVTRARRMALLLGGPERQHVFADRCFAPLMAPGGEFAADAPLARVADELGRRWLGAPARILASARTYGATLAHAVDRVTLPSGDEPSPLLALERRHPIEREAGPAGLQRVEVRAYRAQVHGQLAPGGACAALLWLPLSAVRQTVRGLPLLELLALPEVECLPAPNVPQPPPDAVVYLPAEYGERYLLRVAAKYGHHAIFEGGADGNGV